MSGEKRKGGGRSRYGIDGYLFRFDTDRILITHRQRVRGLIDSLRDGWSIPAYT